MAYKLIASDLNLETSVNYCSLSKLRPDLGLICPYLLWDEISITAGYHSHFVYKQVEATPWMYISLLLLCLIQHYLLNNNPVR